MQTPAGSNIWTASYTVAGSIDATNRNVSVTATGGTNGATTTADTSNLSVDDQRPVVTDGNITITSTPTGNSNTTYIVGNKVTAQWDNRATSGDSNADIAGVTMDFSPFGGGSAVTATQTTAGSNIWTASYTIAPGTTVASNLNVKVTATDDAGNTQTTADTSNLSMDNHVPAVTDAHISIVSTGDRDVGDLQSRRHGDGPLGQHDRR